MQIKNINHVHISIHCLWLRLNLTIEVGGYLRRVVNKKPPRLTVFENKMARHHGTCHLFFFFFSSTKTNNMSTVKFDWKSREWQVLIGRWRQRLSALPYFIIIFFFFLFFVWTLSPTHTHTHTHICKICGRFSPSPTTQLTSRKQQLFLQYVHTLFLSNNIKEEQGKNDSHPERK